jgi:predicted ATPase
VAPMPQAQLDDALARLCESGLAFRRGTPPDAIYTFKHALVQDAAYDALLRMVFIMRMSLNLRVIGHWLNKLRYMASRVKATTPTAFVLLVPGRP